MKKRLIAGIVSVMMVASLVTGCGTGSGTDKGNAQAEKDSSAKTKLTIAYVDTNDDGDGNSQYKQIMKAYDSWDKKDQVELDLQPIIATDSDYFTKIQLELSYDSTTPDIFWEDTFQLNSDVNAGYITDLTEYVNGYEDWSTNYIDAVKEGVTGADGNVYAVPASTDLRGLWYNKNVFEAAGLGRDWQPETWEDILNACRTIKENSAEDVVPMWFPCSSADGEGTSMQTYEMLYYGTGEKLVDDSTGVWTAKSQGILDTLGFVKTIFDEDMGGEIAERLDTNSWVYAAQYMAEDKLGIYLDGSWTYNNFKEGASYEMDDFINNLGFAKMPLQNGGGYVTMSGGWSWAIPELADQKDLAFEFIEQMMQPDNYIEYLTGSGNLATRDMSDFEAYTSRPYYKEFTEGSENATYRPHDENYSQVSTYIYQMVDSIVRNSTSPEDAMSTFATSVEGTVGADKVVDLTK
ncbi:MAG: extracellular solute-binding protein [Velocimicrobium sp.]